MGSMRELLNLQDYTVTEHLLFGVGCALWVVVFLVLLVRIRRLKFVEMPVVAACSNFAWEALRGTAQSTDMGDLHQWCYSAWLLFDVFIFVQVLRYGDKQVATPALKRHFKPIAVAGALFFAAAYHAFVQDGHDNAISARSAYIAQVLVSSLYFLVLLQPEHRRHLSALIAWLRCVATGLISVFVFMRYTSDHLLLVLAVATTALDALFLLAFHKTKDVHQ